MIDLGLSIPTVACRNKAAGGGAFSPSDLSPEVWLDMSDSATLFQEITGASASTTAGAGDPVGTVENKGTDGGYYVAPNTSSRPLLQQDGAGDWYLESDGVAKNLRGSSGQLNTGILTIMLGCRREDDGWNWHFGIPQIDAGHSNPWFRAGINQLVLNIRAVVNGTQYNTVNNPYLVSTNYVCAYYSDQGVAILDRNTTDQATWTPATITHPNTTRPTMFSGGDGSSDCLNGRIYQVIALDRDITGTERTDLEDWVAGKCGVTL